MEYLEKIFEVAKIINSLYNEVKMNHKRCYRLKKRIESLLDVVKAIQAEELDGLTKFLKEMMEILESARDFIKSFTNKHRFSKVFKAFEIREEFNHLNERLNDAAVALDLALHNEQTKMLLTIFKGNQRKTEDEKDIEEDQKFLNLIEQKLEEALLSVEERMQQAVETLHADLGEVKMNLKDIQHIMEAYQTKASVHHLQGIRELNLEEIEIESKPFLITSNSKYYKGMFHKFPVAIKRFVNVGSSNVQKIRSIFRKEAETMKHFESPNIVRIYGICIDQRGASPEFLIVMEYCELGCLRSVLESKWHLSWQSRVHMALDAAIGLYRLEATRKVHKGLLFQPECGLIMAEEEPWTDRSSTVPPVSRLHQSTEKFKFLCSVDSTRFLVDHGLRVKLGGMDLAKTESSIRQIDTSSEKSQLLPYVSPEQMSDINYKYDKPCEVYSFGIVLWEIASRKAPFKGCSNQEILKKICEERVCEPLPSDCPKDFCELIDECRAFDPFERPKAGAIVDRLKNILKRITEATKEARN